MQKKVRWESPENQREVLHPMSAGLRIHEAKFLEREAVAILLESGRSLYRGVERRRKAGKMIRKRRRQRTRPHRFTQLRAMSLR